jgi:hypothetical protein
MSSKTTKFEDLLEAWPMLWWGWTTQACKLSPMARRDSMLLKHDSLDGPRP